MHHAENAILYAQSERMRWNIPQGRHAQSTQFTYERPAMIESGKEQPTKALSIEDVTTDAVNPYAKRINDHTALVPDWSGDMAAAWKACRLRASAVPLQEDVRWAHTYTANVIPDLLQTPDYARKLITWRQPTPTFAQIENALTHLDSEQRQVDNDHHRKDTVFTFVIDETALSRAVGGRAIMMEQLAYLMACAERPWITVQFAPLHRGTFLALTGPTTVHVTAQGTRVYTRSSNGHMKLVTDAYRAAALVEGYHQMRTHALPREESMVLLKRRADDFRFLRNWAT